MHQPANTNLTFQKNYTLHLAKNCYHTFVHSRYSFVIYLVSKGDKHHSTYSSMCQCYSPGHFATYSRRFHSTPLSHTRLHLTRKLLYIKSRYCVEELRHFYQISTVYILVSDGGEIGFHISLFIII